MRSVGYILKLREGVSYVFSEINLSDIRGNDLTYRRCFIPRAALFVYPEGGFCNGVRAQGDARSSSDATIHAAKRGPSSTAVISTAVNYCKL